MPPARGTDRVRGLAVGQGDVVGEVSAACAAEASARVLGAATRGTNRSSCYARSLLLDARLCAVSQAPASSLRRLGL